MWHIICRRPALWCIVKLGIGKLMRQASVWSHRLTFCGEPQKYTNIVILFAVVRNHISLWGEVQAYLSNSPINMNLLIQDAMHITGGYYVAIFSMIRRNKSHGCQNLWFIPSYKRQTMPCRPKTQSVTVPQNLRICEHIEFRGIKILS